MIVPLIRELKGFNHWRFGLVALGAGLKVRFLTNFVNEVMTDSGRGRLRARSESDFKSRRRLLQTPTRHLRGDVA